MAIAIDEQLADLSADDVLKDLLALAGQLGLNVTAWQPGQPQMVLMDIFAAWFTKLWNAIVLPALRAQFLDFATGIWLRLVAATLYNRPALEATFAGGDLVLENRGNGFYSITPGQIRVKNANGKTFTNKTGGTLGPWAGYPSGNPSTTTYPTLTVSFAADEAGGASSTVSGGIQTALVSGPSLVFVRTNTSPMLGSDAEEDDPLKTRCRVAVGELSPGGPEAAYISVALDPVGAFTRRGLTPPPSWGTNSPNINRVRVRTTGNASVAVDLASPTGAASGDNVTADTDVFKSNIAIQMFVAPPGVTVTVASAVEHPIAYGVIDIFVDPKSRVTKADAEATAMGALGAFFRLLLPGGARTIAGGQGYVYNAHVAAICQLGKGVYMATVPGGDVALAANEVTRASYSVVAHLVGQ